MDKILSGLGLVVGFIILIFFASLLFAIPTMYLWDWLMPKLFSLPEISLVEAWGLNMLASILFKSNNKITQKSDNP